MNTALVRAKLLARGQSNISDSVVTAIAAAQDPELFFRALDELPGSDRDRYWVNRILSNLGFDLSRASTVDAPVTPTDGLDARDSALQHTCPLIAVPQFSHLAPMQTGKRYLAGHDGLYVEATSPVLQVCLPIAPVASGALPYGQVQPYVRIPDGSLPTALIAKARQHAIAACPDESAFVLLYGRGRVSSTFP